MARRRLDDLRRLVLAHAPEEGMASTAVPGLRLNRSHRPVLHKRVEAPSVTFAVIVQGKKDVTIGGETLSYAPGSYLFVTGERRYTATIAEASEEAPYLSLALVLSPEDLSAAVLDLADAGDTKRQDPPAIVSRLDDELLDATTRLVGTLSDAVERRVLAPLVTKEIIFRLLRSDSAAALRQAIQRRDDRIARAVRFIRANVHERLSVEQIARRVAMSPSHFAHRFRDIVRMSPMQFVRHVRLHQARLLLLSDGLAAAEVAEEVGYASPSHFSRDFKSLFGDPPRTYARRFRSA